MQSVSEMCRNEVDESAPLVLPTLLALATPFTSSAVHPEPEWDGWDIARKLTISASAW